MPHGSVADLGTALVTRGRGSRTLRHVQGDGERDAPHLATILHGVFRGACRLHALPRGYRHAQFQADFRNHDPQIERSEARDTGGNPACDRAGRSGTNGRAGVGRREPRSRPCPRHRPCFDGGYACGGAGAANAVHGLCQDRSRWASDGGTARRAGTGSSRPGYARAEILRRAGARWRNRRSILRRICRCRCGPTWWCAGFRRTAFVGVFGVGRHQLLRAARRRKCPAATPRSSIDR